MYFREIWCSASSMVARERKREILCHIFEVWDESLNMRSIEPNKIAKAIGGRQQIRKLAKLSVFFEVHITTVKEATITKNKTKQTVSQISNCHYHY